MTRQPDIVLVMTDQQRFDQLGFSSGGHFQTPNLDALAARGVVFDGAYSTSTVCVPSRVSLLTGLQPHRLPTQENRYALREGFWTVAHALAAAGYETALIGKMHFAPLHSEHGFETMRLCEHLSAQGLGPLSVARGDELDDYHYWLLGRGLPEWRSEPIVQGGAFQLDPRAHPTNWVAAEVEQFLAERASNRPLFLVVSFPHPHAPYNPPEPYASMFDPDDSVLPSGGFELNARLPIPFQLALQNSPTRQAAANRGSVAAFLATYRGLIKHIDDAIGDVLARFDEDSTAIFFTTDHGDYSGHRGLLRKAPWIPFDDLARVPFVVAGPGIVGGRREQALVQSSDFTLTCLDFAGVSPPASVEFDSRSLRPLLEGHAAPGDLDRLVYCATTMGWPMVRRGRYKYVMHHQKRVPALFDMAADPQEQVNLARDPGHADVCAELSTLLDTQLEQPLLDLPAVGR